MPVFGWPKVELYEHDKEVTLAAEVPGMSEKDLEIMLEDDALILRGKRKSERNDNERQFTERYYGSFERRIPLPVEVQAEKVGAKVRHGCSMSCCPRSPAPSRTRAASRSIRPDPARLNRRLIQHD